MLYPQEDLTDRRDGRSAGGGCGRVGQAHCQSGDVELHAITAVMVEKDAEARILSD